MSEYEKMYHSIETNIKHDIKIKTRTEEFLSNLKEIVTKY